MSMSTSMRFIPFIKTLIFIAALAPFVRLALGAYADALGANPIEKILRNTGFWTLSFLLITLSVTPLRSITGTPWIGPLRRMLGLFAFFYASLHFFTYVGIDQFFDWDNISKDILKRPYVTVGFAALLLLIPLAITSTQTMMRRLGGQRWQKLHRAIYLIAVLGVIHFWWLVKKDLFEPMLFASGVFLLLAFRIYARRKKTLRRSDTRPSHGRPS